METQLERIETRTQGKQNGNTREETVKIKLETPRLKLKYTVRHMARKEGGKHMRTGLTRKTKEGDKKRERWKSQKKKEKGERETERDK